MPLLAALLLQVAYQTSGTPVMASERVVTYDIAGTTSAGLWEQIRLHGPTDRETGTHYTGDLAWEIHWRYDLRGDDKSCHVESLDVTIDTTMTLPRWTNAREGSNALQTDWDVFLSRLKEHEFGHRSNATRAAQAAREAVDGLGSSADCQSLESRLNEAAHAALDHWKQVDADYDRTTRHGETQGAVLH